MASRSSRLSRAVGAVLFCSLLGAFIGVFVLLPRWTADRPSTAGPVGVVDSVGLQAPTGPPPPDDREPPVHASVREPTARPRPTPSPPPQRRETPRHDPPDPATPVDTAFVAAMSRGLEALERGQWDAARDAFETASNLRPGAPEVADGLARAAAAERRALVRAGTRQGLELESSEAWREAEEVYEQVLAVDPEAAGALEGRDRAARRADLDEKLQYHIDNPDRLSSPAVFDDASGLLAEARDTTPRGPRLEGQVSRLADSLEVASTPIPIVVVSDNQTDVVIYRVDRLGVFSRRRLDLKPGVYTAVGSRDGFRDVRVRFTVTPGAPPEPVTVVCTEKL